MMNRRLSVLSVVIGLAIWMVFMTEPVHAELYSVCVPVANIRSAPNASGTLLWKVEKYHPLDVIEKKGVWYRFRDFEGDEGWIHKSLLDKTPAVIVKENNGNVRSGPDTSHDIVFKVEAGIPFKVLKREGKWIHIQHADGDSGWIYSSLVWP